MFEKEAEENGFGIGCTVNPTTAFQKGVEFGYNKAKVEVEDSYRESLCNSELNLASVTEQLEELKKEKCELLELKLHLSQTIFSRCMEKL